MIKKLKYILIIIPIILSILLITNIYIYYDNSNKLKDTVKNNNNFQEKNKESSQQIENLTNQINKLKEEKKDKIWEYDRWSKWNQEIKEKIN